MTCKPCHRCLEGSRLSEFSKNEKTQLGKNNSRMNKQILMAKNRDFEHAVNEDLL